jgi:hypothetical protein
MGYDDKRIGTTDLRDEHFVEDSRIIRAHLMLY